MAYLTVLTNRTYGFVELVGRGSAWPFPRWNISVKFNMRTVYFAFLTCVLVSPVIAGTSEVPAPLGLPKVELLQEVPVGGLRKLLGWSNGNAYFAKMDGSVSVAGKDGKEIAVLQAKESNGGTVLKKPEAVAVSGGVAYVVDSDTNRVAMFTEQGKYQGSFGYKTGGGFFGGKGNSLSSPRGIAIHDGIVYVSDSGNSRIQMYGDNGVFLATLEIDTAPENTAAKDKKLPYMLDEPTDIAIDSLGQIYVLDADDELIKVYSPVGVFLKRLPGKVKAISFAISDDGIYVADRDTYSIDKYDFKDKHVYSFGSRGKDRAQFQAISGLAIGQDHHVMVGDGEKKVADIFKVESGVVLEPEVRHPSRTSVRWEQVIPVSVGKVAWDGKGTIYGVDTENKGIVRIVNGVVSGEIRVKEFSPVSVAVDGSGFLWALDKTKGRIVKLDESGKILAGFGTTGSHNGEFDGAEDFAISSAGLILVADAGNGRIQAFSSDGVFLKEIHSDSLGKLDDPVSIDLDSQDAIYVLDKGRSVISTYSSKLEPLGVIGKRDGGKDLLSKPTDLMLTRDELFVVDSGQVRVFSHKGQYIRSFANNGSGPGELDGPLAIAKTGDTTFAISDLGNKRVQVFSTLYKSAAPSQFAALGSTHAIELHWAAPEMPYIKQYLIYRSADENSGFVQVGTSGTNEYIDSGLEADKLYYYRVAGETNYGFVGPKSEPVNGVSKKFIPPPLKNVMVETSQSQLKITWEPVDPKYFSAFLIYQKDGEEFTRISEVSLPEFTKDSLAPNTLYTFYISTRSSDGTESDKYAATGTTPPSNKAPLEIEVIKLQDVFSNSYKLYEQEGVGRIKLTNNTDKPIENIKTSFMLNNFMDFPTEGVVSKLQPGGSEEIILKAVFNNSILNITEDSSIQARIEASYFQDGKREAYTKNATLSVYDKHRMTWNEHERFSSFVTPKDAPVIDFVRAVATEFKDTKDESNLAAALFDTTGVMGFTYIQSPSDPYQVSLAKTETTAKTDTVDYVQYPRETLERRSGDCVDLVAFYSTSLESMGIPTLALEVPDHLLMMFSTGISADADGYTMNDLYVIHEGMLWIPVETTVVGKPFIKAWELGAANYYKWKDKGLTILDVHTAWNTYKPATLPNSALKTPKVTSEAIEKKFPGDTVSMLKISSQTKTRRYLQAIEKNPRDMEAHLQMGIILAKIGDRKESMKYFDKVLGSEPKNAAALNNRGNIFMLDGKYSEAKKSYIAASQADPKDPYVWVNLAKSYKAVNNTKDAKAAFVKAQKLDPSVKEKYKAMGLELLNAL